MEMDPNDWTAREGEKALSHQRERSVLRKPVSKDEADSSQHHRGSNRQGHTCFPRPEEVAFENNPRLFVAPAFKMGVAFVVTAMWSGGHC